MSTTSKTIAGRPRLYIWTVLTLIAIQAVAAVLSIYFAGVEVRLHWIGIGVVVFAALASGERLADAGYRRWIGIAPMIFIGGVIPLFGFLLWLAFSGLGCPGHCAPWPNFLGFVLWLAFPGLSGIAPHEVYYIGFGVTLLLLSFVLWVASRPSVARQA